MPKYDTSGPVKGSSTNAEPTEQQQLDGLRRLYVGVLMPRLGQVVYYVLGIDSERPGEHRAAHVTGIHPGSLNLNLLVMCDKWGDINAREWRSTANVGLVEYDPTGKTPHSWHWPAGNL